MRTTNTAEWSKVRRVVIERDGGQCVRCGRKTQLEVHHIDPVWHGGPDTPDNLIALCHACHGEWGAVEEAMCIDFDTWLDKVPPYVILASVFLQTPPDNMTAVEYVDFLKKSALLWKYGGRYRWQDPDWQSVAMAALSLPLEDNDD